MQVMFDTNVFSNLSKGQITPAAIPAEWQPVATHIQWDEIQATKDLLRRQQIEEVFCSYVTQSIATTSAVWGVSKWNEAEWTGPSSLYESIRQQMDETKPHKNNPKDALIAGTCAAKGITLVTNDKNLATIAGKFGVKVVNLQDPTIIKSKT